MYISVSLNTINIEGSGLEYEAEDNLHDIFAKYPDYRMPVIEPELRYFVTTDNHIFELTEAIEKHFPTLGHDLCWNWTGVRKNAEYYLQLDVLALPEQVAHFWQVFNSVFPHVQESDTPFSIPEIDFPLDLDDLDTYELIEDYEARDEDKLLRDFEMLDINNSAIQWHRKPNEYNGSNGALVIIGVAAGVGSFAYTFLKDFVKSRMRKHYLQEIERHQKEVIKACNGVGRIIPPEPEPPKVYCIERSGCEYEFTQILSDGSRNRVFIDVESGEVTFVPYQQEKK